MYEMDHGLRSSEGFIKKKSSSGCLIIKKRIGSSSGPVPRKIFGSIEERERLNTGLSISGSSEDSLEPIKRGVLPRGDKFYDGSGMYGTGILGNNSYGRNREFEGERRRTVDESDGLYRKRIRKDDSQERYGIRHSLDIDSTNNPYIGTGYADEVRSTVSPLRRTFHVPANKVIRVQGKNGVLKVMVHKSKNVDTLRKYYDFQMEDVGTFDRSGSKSELAVNTNLSVGPSNYLGLKHREIANSSIRIDKCEPKLQNSLCKTSNATVRGTTHKSYDYHHQGFARRDSNSEIEINKNSRMPVFDLDRKNGNSSPLRAEKSEIKLQNPLSKRTEAGNSETKESDLLLKPESTCMVNQKKNMLVTHKSNDHQQQDLVRRGSNLEFDNNKNGNSLLLKAEKSEIKLQNLLSKRVKSGDSETENSDSSLNLEQVGSSLKAAKGEVKTSLPEKVTFVKCKETKVKRGTGTEKQLLREKIRHKLVNAGWKIDYRPRKNRDYLDAVYTSPSGTAYWSIIKAYEAFKKLMGEEDVPAELLNKLTRQTRKKMEKEMMMKQREEEARRKNSEDIVRGEGDMENDDNNGKLSFSQKPNGKLLKRKAENSPSEANSYLVEERKTQIKDDNDENLRLLGNPNGKSLKRKAEKPPVETNSHLILERKNQENDGDDENSILLPKHDSKSLKLKAEKPPIETNSHLIQERKSQQNSVSTLLIRSFEKGLKAQNDGYVPYLGKRTVLSWLIDSKTVDENKKVQYMNRKRTKVMLEGYITKDGIHCGCCGKVVTVSKFEIHAGSKLQNPFRNMFLESGVSLFQCQMEAWNRQDEAKKCGFYNLKIDGDDGNDDACGVCGDGGDMICCDSCPSTFHQSCIGIQTIPSGDWHCPNCMCKFCERSSARGNALLTCSMCERKYHKFCGEEIDAFCGKKCQEMFNQLLKLLEVKHELGAGYSWSLIHRTDIDIDASQNGFEQKVECNSKLAVALSVIEECFLPITDRRSGINLIHNVLYNRGSNYSRLNHGGFYTGILERGDEIIAAASIRIHGTQLAEMPFIGIRHVYRRQGMCRRLLCAIESALSSLKVEKLVIPTVAGNLRTWTGSFGFNTLEKSDKKEMRPLKLLVFPRTNMLQKTLMKENNIKDPLTAKSGAKTILSKEHQQPIPDVKKSADFDPSFRRDPNAAKTSILRATVCNADTSSNSSSDMPSESN